MANLEAQASPLAAPASLINFNVRVPVLIPLMLAGLVLRLALASIHGFAIDTGTFQSWAGSLSHDGPWNFYQPGQFHDYAPGYMYVLLAIGEMDKLLHFTNHQWGYVLKLPSIVADLGSAYLLYRMLAKEKPAVQLAATAIYLFFPCALLVGAVWGQVDSILAFFLLLTVYFIGREKPVAGAVAYTVGFMIKPQAIAALPFLAFWIVRDHPANLSDFVALLRWAVRSVRGILQRLFGSEPGNAGQPPRSALIRLAACARSSVIPIVGDSW